MKNRDLVMLLSTEDPDAEVMVSVDMLLSRSDPRPGVLIVPTRCIEAGRFVDGDMAGRPWVSVVGTDAWGISPATPMLGAAPSANAVWIAKVIRSNGWCGHITVEGEPGEPPHEVGCILPAGHDDGTHDEKLVLSVRTDGTPLVARVESGPSPSPADSRELYDLAQRIAKGRAKYPAGCTILSLLDEAGEVAHAVNKREGHERVMDELLDVAAVAMRLYLGEVDTEWQPSAPFARRAEEPKVPT